MHRVGARFQVGLSGQMVAVGVSGHVGLDRSRDEHGHIGVRFETEMQLEFPNRTTGVVIVPPQAAPYAGPPLGEDSAELLELKNGPDRIIRGVSTGTDLPVAARDLASIVGK